MNEEKFLLVWSLANTEMRPVITSQQINKKFLMVISAMQETGGWEKAVLRKIGKDDPWEEKFQLNPT